VKLPAPLEKDVLRAIKQYLEAAGCLVVRVNSGAMRGSHNGKRWFMRFTSEPGTSDLVCCVPVTIRAADGSREWECGEFLGLEVKRAKSSHPTPAQRSFGAKVGLAGGTWRCVCSIDEVRAVLREMGARRVP
jgi:hypothetical protein